MLPVIDTCQDGKYKPKEDYISADTFTVQTLSNEQLAELPRSQIKEIKAKYGELADQTQNELNLWLDIHGSTALYALTVGLPTGLLTLLLLTGASGLVAIGLIVGIASIALGLSLVTYFMSKLKVSRLTQELGHWRGIQNNPPDPDFKHLTVLQGLDPIIDPGTNDPLTVSIH